MGKTARASKGRVMEMTATAAGGVDKLTRYGWTVSDSPGEFRYIHKDELQVDSSYQRDIIEDKVKTITAEWSWLNLGAIVVGYRNGEFWVIDGQHRVVSAKRRVDITLLPCIVFKTEDVKSEAKAFLGLNTGRRPVSAIGKYKAMVASGDPVAVYVNTILKGHGLEIKDVARSANHIRCIAWCIRRAKENPTAFNDVLSMGLILAKAEDTPVLEQLLEALWFINLKYDQGLSDKKLTKRMQEKGHRVLLEAAKRASAYYAYGGGRIWARGVLDEVNKGLRHKFQIDGLDGVDGVDG